MYQASIITDGTNVTGQHISVTDGVTNKSFPINSNKTANELFNLVMLENTTAEQVSQMELLINELLN